ncbi:unnamed protein product [Dibothriocephalus latus]|uniref:Uncharacterized protein n=1 Tax=Dibothriocephalus latus TaxID=60516 RepID=A0A3P7P448_DIBLA|nr:unnamed protein product [Dibothriocephalus latus]
MSNRKCTSKAACAPATKGFDFYHVNTRAHMTTTTTTVPIPFSFSPIQQQQQSATASVMSKVSSSLVLNPTSLFSFPRIAPQTVHQPLFSSLAVVAFLKVRRPQPCGVEVCSHLRNPLAEVNATLSGMFSYPVCVRPPYSMMSTICPRAGTVTVARYSESRRVAIYPSLNLNAL